MKEKKAKPVNALDEMKKAQEEVLKEMQVLEEKLTASKTLNENLLKRNTELAKTNSQLESQNACFRALKAMNEEQMKLYASQLDTNDFAINMLVEINEELEAENEKVFKSRKIWRIATYSLATIIGSLTAIIIFA